MPEVKTTFRIFVVTVFAHLNLLMAQEDIPELITDRPDITESASIVNPGWLQIETGFALMKDSFSEGTLENEISNYNIAGTLLRYGVSQSVEIRAGGVYQVYRLTNELVENEETGFSDLFIGAKISLITNAAKEPRFSVLVHLYPPFGNEFFRSETIEPEIIFAGFNNLGDNFSLSYNAGGRWNFKDEISSYVLSLAGGFNIAGNLSGYVETYSEFSNESIPGYFFDGGFVYLLQKNIQIDISSGFGILENSSSWFISSGLSVRIPR